MFSIYFAQRCFLGTEKNPRKGASGRKQHRVAILCMRDHYGGRQLGAETRDGAYPDFYFSARSFVEFTKLNLKTFFDEIAQVRARAAQNRPSRIAAICRGYTKACPADPDPRSQVRPRVWLRAACA